MRWCSGRDSRDTGKCHFEPAISDYPRAYMRKATMLNRATFGRFVLHRSPEHPERNSDRNRLN